MASVQHVRKATAFSTAPMEQTAVSDYRTLPEMLLAEGKLQFVFVILFSSVSFG